MVLALEERGGPWWRCPCAACSCGSGASSATWPPSRTERTGSQGKSCACPPGACATCALNGRSYHTWDTDAGPSHECATMTNCQIYPHHTSPLHPILSIQLQLLLNRRPISLLTYPHHPHHRHRSPGHVRSSAWRAAPSPRCCHRCLSVSLSHWPPPD
jgi:hypothetical protein